MNLVLIGYMGSGKSAVGRALAQTLDFQFNDLDQLIEQSERQTIAGIFQTKGEIYFRKKEAEAIRDVLSKNKKLILATGGGTPCYGNTMDFLLQQPDVSTIYLKTSLEVLTGRLFIEKESRPLIAHLKSTEDLNDFIRKHLFERTAVYERANEIVTTDGLEVTEIVREIIARLF